MGITERKRRAFQAREQLVIETADELLEEHGYLGLNLDELADRVEYSKATLYHHFQSKEDLVLAVVVRHVRLRVELFQMAQQFQGLTREKMFAFACADRFLSEQYQHSFSLAQLVSLPSIWNKCSEDRQNTFFENSKNCLGLAISVVEAARQMGDLPEDVQPERVVWGLISLSKGANLIAEERHFKDRGTEALSYLFANYHAFLDGLNWKPLSSGFDYENSRQRIGKELFDHSRLRHLSGPDRTA